MGSASLFRQDERSISDVSGSGITRTNIILLSKRLSGELATRRLPRFVVNELAGLTYKITRVQRDRVSAPTRVNHTHTNSFVSTRPPSMDKNPDLSCTQHDFPSMTNQGRARVAPAPGAANRHQEGESQQKGPHGSSQDIAHCIAAILHTTLSHCCWWWLGHWALLAGCYLLSRGWGPAHVLVLLAVPQPSAARARICSARRSP